MAQSTTIQFVCESCQKLASPRHIRRWQGRCKRCDGRSWTLVVNYIDKESEFSPLVTLALFILVGGWSSGKTSANQIAIAGVSDTATVKLTEDRRQVVARVDEYLRVLNQRTLLQQGGRSCTACGVTFVPTENKPWTQQGYCSKSCGAQVEAAPVMFEEQTPGDEDKPTITVRCPSGHTFDVMATFAGCIRPCPVCGAKCPVG